MFKGTLEGIESSYDSVGLGLHEISFSQMPILGQRFACYIEDDPLSTGTIKRSKIISANEVRFMTNRTTYILRISGEVDGPELRATRH